MRYLLDVNILVALAFPSHSSHSAAHTWFHLQQDRPWATCSLTQAGFLRVACRLLGGSRNDMQKALAGLENNCQTPHHEYWPADVDLRHLSASQRLRLSGPNQIADQQLLSLAHRRRGQLVTFDSGLKQLASATPFAAALLLL